jgi:hypothetical protein
MYESIKSIRENADAGKRAALQFQQRSLSTLAMQKSRLTYSAALFRLTRTISYDKVL